MDRYRYLAGKSGEEAAAKEYEKRGCRIIARNWRFGKRGEIDLILEKKEATDREQTIIFSEVKMRAGDFFAPAAAAVNGKKQMRIRMLAAVFLAQHPEFRDHQVRFDVVQVYYRKITRKAAEAMTPAFCAMPEAYLECDILDNAF